MIENPAIIALIVTISLGVGYCIGALFAAANRRDTERRIWRDAERLFAARLRQHIEDHRKP